LKKKYDHESEAIYGSSRLWDDGIIMPEETRDILGLSLTLCQNKSKFMVKESFGVFRMWSNLFTYILIKIFTINNK